MNKADAEAYKLAKRQLGGALASLPLGAYRLRDVLAAVEPTIGMFTTAAADWVLNYCPGVVTVVMAAGFEVWIEVHPRVLEYLGITKDAWDGPTLTLQPSVVFSPVMREEVVKAFDNGMTGDLLGLDVLAQLDEPAA